MAAPTQLAGLALSPSALAKSHAIDLGNHRCLPYYDDTMPHVTCGHAPRPHGRPVATQVSRSGAAAVGPARAASVRREMHALSMKADTHDLWVCWSLLHVAGCVGVRLPWLLPAVRPALVALSL